MRRLAQWLRIGLTCSVLWMSTAAAADRAEARATTYCYAATAPAAERGTRPDSCKRTRVIRPLRDRMLQPAAQSRVESVRIEPCAPQLPRAPRLYLRNCVLQR